ncbi:50S ribosomal protein L18 [Candidatus Micrarchaeota archaeon]|nr:50S ribosomal protein L18 [Candidatus Micrarchaeota archaeon]
MSRAKTPTYKVPFRRRKEGATNYRKRLALVKSGKTRMVVRKTNKGIIVQFVNFDSKGDKTLITVSGETLRKEFKWPSKRNSSTAYLAGLLGGKKAAEKGVKEFVLDLGLHESTKGSVLYAALKGAADSGLSASFDEGMVPMDKLENVKEEYSKLFEEVKKKILS